MTLTALEFRSVSKVYGSAGAEPRYALREVSFAIPRGRRVAITGRSGSGKSTLLHVAAGIDGPSSGEVLLLGRELSRMSERQRSQARLGSVGFVFQFFHLLNHLSVLDNVRLPAWIAGERGAKVERRATDLLRRVDLGDRSSDPVQHLSGGEMQRVAICRALIREPRLLLADEPTGNLDDDNGRRVMDLLLRLAAEEESTLVFVTHSQEMASLADERWRLHSGILETS